MSAEASMRPLLGGIGAAAGTVVVASVVLAGSRGHRVNPLAFPELDRSPGYQLFGLALLTGVLVGAWLTSLGHPTSAIGISVAAVAAVAPLLAGLNNLPDEARGLLAGSWVLVVPSLGWAVICWQLGAAPRLLSLGLPVLGAAVWLWTALAYDPFRDGECVRTCTQTAPPLADVVPADRVDVVATVSMLAAAALTIVWILEADVLPPALRAVTAPALAVLAAGEVLAAMATPNSEVLAYTTLTRLGAAGAVTSVAAALEARTWVRRRAVTRLARGLGEPDTWGAQARGGGTRVLFAVPGEDRWVDLTGHESPPGDTTVPFDLRFSDGSPFLRLQQSLREAPDGWSRALTPEIRLGLRNAQLAAALRFRIEEVRESQRRVVAASDQERHRLERDLHDGAQQRLVSALLHLRAARSNVDAGTAEWLATIEQSVLDVLAALRRISHGVFPPGLLVDGLDAALDDLVSDASVDVEFDVQLPRSLPAELAMAVYAAVAASLDLASLPSGRGPLAVRATKRDHCLELTMDAPGFRFTESDLVPVTDRVGAAGGTLSVTDQTVRVVIPCGS